MAFGAVIVVAAITIEAATDTGSALDTIVWSPTPGQLLWSLSIGAGVGLVLRGASARARAAPDRSAQDPGPSPLSRLPIVGPALVPAALVGAFGLLALYASFPSGFNALSREDHIVEWTSAAALFVAAAFAGAAARRGGGPTRAILAVGAAGLAWIALEEISYFQRVLGFGTPEDLTALNDQREANLHNVATDLFQNGYYLAIAILFLAFPLVRGALPLRLRAALDVLVPSRLSTTVACASIVFAYAATSYPAHHLTIWIAAWFLLLRTEEPRWWRWALAVLLVIGTTVAFRYGPSLARNWAPSEYRELLSAVALAIWAAEVWLVSSTVAKPISAGSGARR